MRKNRLTSFPGGQKTGAAGNSSTEKPGTWQKLRTLFAEAIQLDRAKRRMWLEQRCAEDSAVAREIVSLLAHDDSDDRFLECPAWNFDTEPGTGGEEEGAGTGLSPGAIVGSWQVLGEISSGGMGTVHLRNGLSMPINRLSNARQSRSCAGGLIQRFLLSASGVSAGFWRN